MGHQENYLTGYKVSDIIGKLLEAKAFNIKEEGLQYSDSSSGILDQSSHKHASCNQEDSIIIISWIRFCQEMHQL